MSTTIESLELEVTSNSKAAVNGLEALTQTLDKLKKATSGGMGLTSVIKQVKGLGDAAKSIDSGSVSNLNGLTKAINTLSNLGGVKLSSALSKQITAIGSAVKGLDGVNFTPFNELASSLNLLSNAGNINIGSAITQLSKVPELMERFSGVNAGNFKEIAFDFGSALQSLDNVSAQNLPSTLKQIKKLPDILNALGKINTNNFETKIKEIAEALDPLAQNMSKITKGLSAFPADMQKLVTNTNKLSATSGKGKFSFTSLFSTLSAGAMVLEDVGSKVMSLVDKSSRYMETVNLFSVSMGQYADESAIYANKLEALMGIDPSTWMKNQGVFMTLTTGFGIAGDRAHIMSQQLTQLGYDLSSFFDLSYDDAMKKLQSGLSGELEPLRRIGYDLSLAKLQEVALSLGIDKTIAKMNQAEKAQLRYYAIMTQVTTAHGDMARTLNQPANQLKILSAQLEQTGRALGNIFIPLLNVVLPYIIAGAKVIQYLAQSIANLFGFEMPEVDYKGISVGAGDTSTALDDATASAEEFKRATMGIDELNVLGKNSTSSVADPIGSSFDFELPTYDFIGDLTENRVSEIVNKMKEWLGITGEINSWADLFNTRLGKILTVVGLIGIGIIGWRAISGITSGIKGITSLFGGVKGIGSGTSFQVPSPNTILVGFADFAIIVGGIISLVGVIGLLSSIPGFDDVMYNGLNVVSTVFGELLKVAVPITLASVFITALGKIGVKTIAKGFADFAIIVGGIPVLVTAIGALMSIPYFSDFASTGVSVLTQVFNGLYEIALPIGVLSGMLVVLGLATPAVILSGLAGFALVVGGLSVVLVALGALNQIPGFSWIVGEGGTVLCQLGNIIGKFVGSIIGGFGEGITASLPQMAQDLSDFMGKLEPFISGVTSIDATAMEGAKSLAQIILVLTAANLIEGLTSWLTGGTSMTDFAAQLLPFGDAMVSFSEKVAGKIDTEAVTAAANAGKIMADMATSLPNSGGVLGFFAGENDMEDFGAQLVPFGEAITEFSSIVAGKIDSEAVTAAANAGKTMAEMAKTLPNSGGVLGFFAGNNDMDVFGKQLVTFGESIVGFSSLVTGNIDAEAVTAAANAGKMMADMAATIPNSGGVVSFFTGDNDMEAFGKQLIPFGNAMVDFSKTVSGKIDTKAVTAAATAGKTIADMATALPDIGENDLVDLANMLPTFGENFKKYHDKIKGISDSIVTKSGKTAQAISILVSNMPTENKIKSLFTGNNGIDKLGEKISKFGSSFKTFYDKLKDINTEKVDKITNSLNKIVSLAVNVSKNVNVDIFGKFVDKIKTLSGNLNVFSKSNDFENSFSHMLNRMISNYETFLNNIRCETRDLFNNIGATNVLDLEIRIPRLNTYATGGFPTIGQMFIAREAGPEMVGTIGNKTAVVNNEQIVSGISAGVADANSEQNALLREQNNLLRQIVSKIGSSDGSTGSIDDIISMINRRNYRASTNVIG